MLSASGMFISSFHYSGVASQKARRGQPAPWHSTIFIMIAQKSNDQMWASQHTELLYNMATVTTWTFIYYVTTAGIEVSLEFDLHATTVLQKFRPR